VLQGNFRNSSVHASIQGIKTALHEVGLGVGQFSARCATCAEQFSTNTVGFFSRRKLTSRR
jgi:hypothetical protein